MTSIAQSTNAGNGGARNAYMILSPKSLPYARHALTSLFRNALDPIHLRMITDTPQDKEELIKAAAEISIPSSHSWKVIDSDELADREASLFGEYENLRVFRAGHPCWRKITDPLLMSEGEEEMIVLDPDLYFPNRFRFEETPAKGVLLMWQKPNCLLPAETVKAAMQEGVRLAHHVDIGVAHWRGPADLDWLNWLIGRLGGASIPRMMHVEAIVWSAIAMRIGGGHLAPEYWKCWHRTVPKRLMRKLGVPGPRILQHESLRKVKCFHAGGEAKWWLAELLEKTTSLDKQSDPLSPGKVLPFVELIPASYSRQEGFRRLLHTLDQYFFTPTA